MIRNLSIWILVGIFMSCGSSDQERSGSGKTNSITFEKRSEGIYISDDVMANLAAERRSKLSKLYSDGSSWFSFRIEEPFDELEIVLIGKQSSYSMSWNAQSEENNKKVLPFKKVNLGDFNIDILLTPGQVEVFFNEGLESFLFSTESQKIEARVEVYLDGELRDIPGALYDIGV